jgi:hypothetical protein
MAEGIHLLWTHEEWRCELHTGPGRSGRLLVFHRSSIVTAENVEEGRPAEHRAEVLRQRVLRGDLRQDR